VERPWRVVEFGESHRGGLLLVGTGLAPPLLHEEANREAWVISPFG
jgi:hypothetical protein